MKNTKELNKQKIKIKEKDVGTIIGRPLLQGLDHRKGITLIALIITIILMLILATVTVNVAINGGLFEYAGNAKYNTEIASEREMIQKASVIAESTSKTGRVTVEEMQKAINKVADGSNITAIDNTETIAIKFGNSNRYYTLDSKGKVTGPIEFVKDDNAGDLSKNGKYNGETEKTAFLITCIEDLVEFSVNYTKYKKSYVKLDRTLDFNSIFSYNDYSTKIYGNLNGDKTTDDIKTELTKQGDNCGGFIPIADFHGTFDGQGNKICNLYENRGGENAGLFASSNGIIKNLGLENANITGSTYIGGIVADTGGGIYVERSKISNCFVEGKNTIKMINTTGDCYIGLMVGVAESITIENCHSKGEIDIKASRCSFGGLAGKTAGDAKIIKSYNIMDIDMPYAAGGIVGFLQGGACIVEECYHIGDISAEGNTTTSGGIAAAGRDGTIKNCYNIGSVGNWWSGGIVSGFSSVDCFNCYSVGEITSPRYMSGGTISGINEGGHIVHCFGKRGDFGTLSEGELTEDEIISYLSINNNLTKGHADKTQLGYKCNVLTDDEMKNQNFVDELNILIEAGKSGETEGVITNTTQSVWKKDTEGINKGYPIFTWQTVGANTQ